MKIKQTHCPECGKKSNMCEGDVNQIHQEMVNVITVECENCKIRYDIEIAFIALKVKYE